MSPSDTIQKLLSKGYYKGALNIAIGMEYSECLDQIKLILVRYVSVVDYDSRDFLTPEALNTIKFPTDADFDVFLDKLFELYFKYGLLRNLEKLSQEFYGIELSEQVFKNFRYKVQHGEIRYSSSYRYAGMRIIEHRTGKKHADRRKHTAIAA